MLAEKTIQQVRDLSITSVVSHYMKLDRNGGGLCPFHNEKTPSFKVTEKKGMFKCFGCGKGGDLISFVREHDKLGFIEAVEAIAKMMSVPVEYQEVPDKEKYEEQKALQDRMKDVLQLVVERYRSNLWNLPEDHPVRLHLAARGYTPEVIAEWQLGWATEDWQHISSDLINKGHYEPAAQMGIIRRSQDERNYDGYRSRIIFPITNKNGEYLGLGGRFQVVDPADTDKKYPKYINPPQNELYDKSAVLFGLSQAQKAIRDLGFAYLVEGYTDVISMHLTGQENTVGTCGTALTAQQADLLAKYCNHVVILRDGDSAGMKASVRDLYVLLKSRFKVEVIILPDGEDPDTYARKMATDGASISSLVRKDGVMWRVEVLTGEDQDDSFKLGTIQEEVLDLLLHIPNDIIRGNYFDAIVKKFKWKKADLQKRLNTKMEIYQAQEEDEGADKKMNQLPKWMDRNELESFGYCAVNNKNRVGYYVATGGGHVEVTNFLIKPLFHIYAGMQSRFLIQIDNGKKTAVLDIESSALVNIDQLQKAVVNEGPYLIYGNKLQLLRIATNLLENFPKCLEVKYLGWQSSGFFSFSDRIFVPGEGMKTLDEWGVVNHAGASFLVPPASAAFKQLASTDDDEYENLRVLHFRESQVSFSQWAEMMQRVYNEKGWVGIAYVILTLFRDIVFDIDNNCPHLYGFGERSSGKSKWAESICALFFRKRSAFNLNSSTDYAFFKYMQIFINCPSFLNEFDEKVIRPEWFQSIKGAFDGESRQKGVMGSKNKVEIMKIRSTLILIGQYLCTMDDNSIVSRSIIEGFSERELTDEDKKEYDKLKRVEEGGLSNLLIEVLKHRAYFKEHYRDRFNETLGAWRRSIDDSQNFNQRIMQNWCHLLTSWRLIADHITLPIQVEQFEVYCKARALHWSNFIRSSDTLSEFWQTIGFLADQGVIQEGWDYKIEETAQVRIRKGHSEDHLVEFSEFTKVIYLRLNNIHKFYQEGYRKRTGKEGMSLENLKHYFSNRKYYVGSCKAKKFRRFIVKTENVTAPASFPGATPVQRPEVKREEQEVNASCFVFLYDHLGLELEREIPGAPEINGHVVNGKVPLAGEVTQPIDELPF